MADFFSCLHYCRYGGSLHVLKEAGPGKLRPGVAKLLRLFAFLAVYADVAAIASRTEARRFMSSILSSCRGSDSSTQSDAIV